MSGSITLYIRAHGGENFNSSIQEYIKENVYLVSFAGNPGLAGWSTICPDGIPVDLKVLYQIGGFYHMKSFDPTKPTQKDILFDDELRDNLKSIYEYCLRNCSPSVNLPTFSRTNPQTDRNYTLEADKGQDPRISPEYGITVVASSNEDDKEYTFESKMGISSGLSRPTRIANININHDAFEYWMSKSILEGKYKDLIRTAILEDKRVTLSDLIIFFKSMGFKNILIWDTSCRTGPFKGRPSTHNRYGRAEKVQHPGNTPFFQDVQPEPISLEPHDRTRLLFEDNEHSGEICNLSNGFCDMIIKAAKKCYRGICDSDKIDGGRTIKNKNKNKNKNKKNNKKNKLRKTRKNKNRKRI